MGHGFGGFISICLCESMSLCLLLIHVVVGEVVFSAALLGICCSTALGCCLLLFGLVAIPGVLQLL